MNMFLMLRSARSKSLALWASLIVGVTPGLAHAQICKPPSAVKRSEVETYILKRFNITSPADLILVEDKQENDACFWKLSYEAPSKRTITLYLSPDGHYLLPTLYDVRVDPLIEQKAVREHVAKSLLADDGPSIGPEQARITIVEFSDFQCPYCKRMADTLEHDFLSTETQNVRFVYKNFPLPMHPWAMSAAKIAECVALQKPEEFLKVHDYLFEHQKDLTPDNLQDTLTTFVVTNTDVDKTQFKLCVQKDLSYGPVNKDIELGRKNGVSGTPTIFINGVPYVGLKTADQLRALVEEVIGGTSQPSVSATVRSQAEASKILPSACQLPSAKPVQ
jgi:protein-disulfide isomerase